MWKNSEKAASTKIYRSQYVVATNSVPGITDAARLEHIKHSLVEQIAMEILKDERFTFHVNDDLMKLEKHFLASITIADAGIQGLMVNEKYWEYRGLKFTHDMVYKALDDFYPELFL